MDNHVVGSEMVEDIAFFEEFLSEREQNSLHYDAGVVGQHLGAFQLFEQIEQYCGKISQEVWFILEDLDHRHKILCH